MCLGLEWKTELATSCLLPKLLHQITVSSWLCILISNSKELNHMMYVLAWASALHSASRLDLAIDFWFLELQLTKLPPKYKQYPNVDFWLSNELAQPESHNHSMDKVGAWVNLMPSPIDPARYLKMHLEVCQWFWVGDCKNWLSLLTKKAMSGRLRVRYWGAPMVLL